MQRAAAISLPILILVALAVAIPVHAQRGHGGGFHSGGSSFHSSGGFHSGGFASHSAPPSRSFSGFNGSRGIRPVGPARFGAPYGLQPGRSFAPSSNLRMRAPGSFRPNPGVRRPEYDARRPEYPDRDHHHHPHRPDYNYGGTTFYTGTILPYGLYNPYWYGDFGFPYDDSYDDANEDQDYSNPAYDNSNNYVAESAPEAAEPPTPDQPYSSPYNYRSPQAPPAAPPAAPSLPQEPVTLVFNNGAPAQQIHNYILSRSKLIVLDGPRREIPVAELDLEATRKANSAAGIDFNLPN